MKAPLWIRNLIGRMFNLPLVCPDCGEEVFKTDYYVDGVQYYKCLECDRYVV